MTMSNRGRTIGTRLLLLRDFISTHASPTQAVSMKQIQRHLENHDCGVGVKMIYEDIDTLAADFDVTLVYSEKHKGWLYIDPRWEAHELRLMAESIQSSKFITKGKAQAIVDKIAELADPTTRSQLSGQVYVADRVRSMNESVIKETDLIHAAIRADEKIAFRYFHYTPDGNAPKSYSKKGERYIVSPYALYWNNGNYYLYAYDGKKFRYYRVDRMDGIKSQTEKRAGKEEFREKNITHKDVKVFDMYSTGKVYPVKMRFRNELADAVIDQFGRDIMMMPDDTEHFTFVAPVDVSPPFYAWIATFGRRVKIISPPEVVDGMRDFIQKCADMYKDDGNV